MPYRVRNSDTPADLEKAVQLRYEVLRKPWGQSLASASDELESVSANAIVEDEQGQVIACGRLQRLDEESGQIRYMAVAEGFRGKGLGKLILEFLEGEARQWGLKKVVLQARENAREFYFSQHYSLKEKSFLLWGQIQHYLMEKVL